MTRHLRPTPSAGRVQAGVLPGSLAALPARPYDPSTGPTVSPGAPGADPSRGPAVCCGETLGQRPRGHRTPLRLQPRAAAQQMQTQDAGPGLTSAKHRGGWSKRAGHTLTSPLKPPAPGLARCSPDARPIFCTLSRKTLSKPEAKPPPQPPEAGKVTAFSGPPEGWRSLLSS